MPAAYPFLVNRTPRLWHLFWRALERDPRATFTIERGCWSQPPWRTLADHRPDLILSVHPMVQHITAQALARSGSRVPFCTVVTDLGHGPSSLVSSGGQANALWRDRRRRNVRWRGALTRALSA
ncbi:MAG: hypothetical protein R2838_06040 [Caldilineaceae bacterium]